MNPAQAQAFGLWDVVDGAVVTTRGALCGAGELLGLTPTSTTADAWANLAQGLVQGLRRLSDNAYLQAIYCRGRFEDAALARLMFVEDHPDQAGGLASVLAYQRQKRLEYLRQRGLRAWRTYLVWGSARGLSAREFAAVSRKTHERQLELLQSIERQVVAACERAQLRLRRLDDREILALFRTWLDPLAQHPGQAIRREVPLQDDATLKAEPQLRPLSVREQLMPGNLVWDPGWVRCGRTYFRVLTAKKLPPSTTIGALDRPRGESLPLAELDFDFRLVLHCNVPNQRAARFSFNQRRRFAFALAQKGAGEMSDEDAEVAEENLTALARKLANEETLVKVGLQAVLWAPSVRELQQRSSRLADALGKLEFDVYEESWAHDRELFKTLPGLGLGTFDRWRLVTGAVAADLLPTTTYASGDPEPSLVLEDAATRQPFGWNVREHSRSNDNFLILGASGAGKSVFINMLLAYGILAGPSKGRVLAIDYAGPTKSSFRVAAEVFDGRYIPISGDGKKINPFPTKASACAANGRLRPEELAYLTTLTNLLTENVDKSREQALSTGLIQAAIQRLYDRWQSPDQPLYTDFLKALESYPIEPSRAEQKRREDLVKLTRKFLDGPEGGLLNQRTTADTSGDFLVYDLYGLRAYEDRVRSAVALVVTHQVRNTAFDGRPDRYKYVFFEEAANLLSIGMRDTIEELFTTARAHGTSVATITQEYLAYTRSGIDGVVNLNTTTKIFLSHASAENAIEPIIRDFQLNEQESAVLKLLRAERGQYSELMIRTTCRDGLGVSRPVTAKVVLKLSPFDYQVVTSSPDDRATQLDYRAKHPEVPLVQILDYLAYGRAA